MSEAEQLFQLVSNVAGSHVVLPRGQHQALRICTQPPGHPCSRCMTYSKRHVQNDISSSLCTRIMHIKRRSLNGLADVKKHLGIALGRVQHNTRTCVIHQGAAFSVKTVQKSNGRCQNPKRGINYSFLCTDVLLANVNPSLSPSHFIETHLA